MNLWYEKGEKTYFRTGEYDEPQCPDKRKTTRFARGKGCKDFKLICTTNHEYLLKNGLNRGGSVGYPLGHPCK